MKKKLYTSEIVLYIVYGVCWLTGFVFSILGTIAYNVGRITDNPLYQAEKGFAKAFGQADGTVWDFRIFGAIVMVVFMIAFLITIYAYSSKKTREDAATKRKEERMRILMAGDDSSTTTVENKD